MAKTLSNGLTGTYAERLSEMSRQGMHGQRTSPQSIMLDPSEYGLLAQAKVYPCSSL